MRNVFLLVAALASAACTQSPTVPKVEEQVIGLTIGVSDSVLVAGKLDTIRVTVTNTLDQVVRISFPTQCQVKVYIRNVSSNVVLPPGGSYQCAGVSSQLTIAAKGTVVFPFVWSGGQSFLPPDPSQKLPFGVYFVSASLDTDGLSLIAFPQRIRFAQTR
jgi:hypothetical protein